jgi:hypothetical protein
MIIRSTEALRATAKSGFGAAALMVCGVSLAQTTTTPPLSSNDKQIIAAAITSTGISNAATLGNIIGGIVGGSIFTSQVPGANRFALSKSGETGAAGAAGGAKWNGWVAFSQSKVGYSFQPLQTSGTVNTGTVGVDYLLDNRMVVGVAVTGDRTDLGLNFNGGTLKGSGWTISPYLGVPLTRNIALDATLGFGRTKIDVAAAGINGSFDADRTVGSIGVTYRENVGNWQLTGRGAFLAVSDKLGAYTLTNGTFVQGGSVDVQQLRFGGQAGYRMGAVTPYVGLTYIYDLRRPDQQPVAGQTAANDRDAWTPVLGLRFSTGGSLYGGIQYSSEQSRSQVKNNQILLNVGVRF